MIRKILFRFVCSIAALGSLAAGATEPLVIEWSDLVPAKIADPFEKLSRQQLQDVGHVVRVRRLIAADKLNPDGPDAKEAAQIEQRLQKYGVDIAWLMSQRDRVRWMREKRAKAVEPSVVGKGVRLTGYVVPLKTSGNRATEFILVPSIDFCSHGTPPPPNQTVIVNYPNGITSRGLMTAVRVSGRIEGRQTDRVLQRAGGPTTISSAYAIAPTEIEVYSPSP